NRSAKTIAEALQVDPRIARVLYPGLPTHPNHELATKQMHGYGGMLTIEIKADEATTSKVIERLELFALAPSLGGTESVATHPSTITHHSVDPQERPRRGIIDSTGRLAELPASSFTPSLALMAPTICVLPCPVRRIR